MNPIFACAAMSLVCAGPRVVTFDVEKAGDVKWSSKPCTIDVFPFKGKTPVHVGVMADQGVALLPGKYEALVACSSSEGTVKKTVPFEVGRAPQTARVKTRVS